MAQTAAPIPNGLTNWWRAEGNALDTQSNVNGTNNGVGFTAGEVGQAFNFGGGNISFPSAVGNFGTNDFTVDFWFKTTQAEAFGSPIGLLGNRVDCSDGNFLGVRIFTNSTLFVELDQDANKTNYNSVQTSFGVSDGNWHHAAIVRQGTTLTLYIDGNSAGSNSSAAITNITGANPFVVGTDACTGAYNGALDEIHIFNRALSQTEVQSIHNAGSAGLTTLVGWWHFNEGTGSTTADLSGNGNTGTLLGNPPPVWTADPPPAFRHPAVLTFDGLQNYVNVAGGGTSSALNFATQVSIAAWIKPSSLQNGTFGIV
ncbi:MAG: LamG domain-containing protein, partial [Acidobacteria bacterium]|nr:LamG domain-containing protein [Acidobacteriota bacterium]